MISGIAQEFMAILFIVLSDLIFGSTHIGVLTDENRIKVYQIVTKCSSKN